MSLHNRDRYDESIRHHWRACLGHMSVQRADEQDENISHHSCACPTKTSVQETDGCSKTFASPPEPVLNSCLCVTQIETVRTLATTSELV